MTIIEAVKELKAKGLLKQLRIFKTSQVKSWLDEPSGIVRDLVKANHLKLDKQWVRLDAWSYVTESNDLASLVSLWEARATLKNF